MTERKLTAKQQLFVDHYLQCWNATEAARRAGYSEKSAQQIGSENLLKPVISSAIQKRLKDNALSADETLSRLADIARGNIGDFINPDSLTVDIRRGNTALIKRIEYKIYTTDDSQTETVKIELLDQQRALETFAKHYGLLKETVVHETWQDKAIEAIREGKLLYEPLARRFGYSRAHSLFTMAGVPVDSE